MTVETNQRHQPEDTGLEQRLLNLALGHPATLAERQQLATSLLTAAWQVEAFNITPETVLDQVELRLQRLQEVYPRLSELCPTLGWSTCPMLLLWQLWLPMAEQVAVWREALARPMVQGISGMQGTGKTTLALILGEILSLMGFRVCRLSIDDLYKTYRDRQQLQQADPRFHWRGPPGTHDLNLGLQVLQQLRTTFHEPIALPRFDKSAHSGAGDRTQPDWITNPEIILFEGWFVGARPVDLHRFDTAPPPINTAADRDFAREVNQRLWDYLPLWQQLDRLILLYPVDYRLSEQWRQQAEQRMMTEGKSGMSPAEVSQFVEYFWRSLHPELFIKPLLHDPRVDWVIEIDAAHCPQSIHSPTLS